jgi:hypothetical protein
MNKIGVGIGFFVVLMFIGLFIGPFIIIWALNTLFPVLAIPYDIWTWLAVVVLGTLFKTRLEYRKD